MTHIAKESGRKDFLQAPRGESQLDPTMPHRNERFARVLGAVALGILLVVAALALFRYGCPDYPTDGSLCWVLARNPPWPLLATIAAAPSVILTWYWRTVHKDTDIRQKQFEIDLAKREERSKRFFEAVQLLTHDKLDARLAAVYSMESLAKDVQEEHGRVIETLCAFLREHGNSTPEAPDGILVGFIIQATDVQAAFTVIGRMQSRSENLDLRGAALESIEGIELDLSRANLTVANLRNANLRRANLASAHLEDALLEDANLRNANLERTILAGAFLERANLAGVNLIGAILIGAHLEGVDLDGANLEGASLTDAKYSHLTQFPYGFSPVAAGMILVDEIDNPVDPQPTEWPPRSMSSEAPPVSEGQPPGEGEPP